MTKWTHVTSSLPTSLGYHCHWNETQMIQSLCSLWTPTEGLCKHCGLAYLPITYGQGVSNNVLAQMNLCVLDSFMGQVMKPSTTLSKIYKATLLIALVGLSACEGWSIQTLPRTVIHISYLEFKITSLMNPNSTSIFIYYSSLYFV